MANSKSNKIYVIDTASGTAVTLSPLVVNKIRWVGATTAGHTAVVQDQNANPFWSSVAGGANHVESDDFSQHSQRSSSRMLNGLLVPTLGSGVLYIYVD